MDDLQKQIVSSDAEFNVDIFPSPCLLGDNPEKKRQEMLTYFNKTYDLYERLFECITDEAYFVRPNPLRHPLIFYYAHPAVFYWNKIVIAGIADQSIDADMEQLMAMGVDEMSWDDLNIPEYRWPSLEKVKQYRQKIKLRIVEIIKTLPLRLPITWDSPWWAIMMGIEHDRIHLETSSVLIRQLPLQYVKPHPAWLISRNDNPVVENKLLIVEAGPVVLGRGDKLHYYGWDNELGILKTTVEAFQVSQMLVSNAEYLAFVEDQGYRKEEYWSQEGWAWVSFTQDKMPSFWIQNAEGRFQLRCMCEVIAMPWSWPVVVNALEAEAFCRWKSKQIGVRVNLQSEAQYKRLQDSVNPNEDFWYRIDANINLKKCASEMPVDQFRQGDFFDVIGNVWQWTRTPIDGLSGFKTSYLYEDFSTPTFDGQHAIIKGGSWISTGNEAGYYARYAFRRHFHQHASFRYVVVN